MKARAPAATANKAASSASSKPDGFFDEQKKPVELAKESKGWGPGLGQDLDPGDLLVVTGGRESYGSFEVGPIAVTITVRAGEGIEEAFLRAHRVVDALFEAEFALKTKQHPKRVVEFHAGLKG